MSPKHNRAEIAFEKMRLEVVESHVERISRFKGKVRPSDYARLLDYATALHVAVSEGRNVLPAKVRKAHLKKVIK